jgi:hypothetical protein
MGGMAGSNFQEDRCAGVIEHVVHRIVELLREIAAYPLSGLRDRKIVALADQPLF